MDCNDIDRIILVKASSALLMSKSIQLVGDFISARRMALLEMLVLKQRNPALILGLKEVGVHENLKKSIVYQTCRYQVEDNGMKNTI